MQQVFTHPMLGKTWCARKYKVLGIQLCCLELITCCMLLLRTAAHYHQEGTQVQVISAILTRTTNINPEANCLESCNQIHMNQIHPSHSQQTRYCDLGKTRTLVICSTAEVPVFLGLLGARESVIPLLKCCRY